MVSDLLLVLMLVSVLAIPALGCESEVPPTPRVTAAPTPTPLPTALGEWAKVFRAAADMGVDDNVVRAIQAADPAQQASGSCAAMFSALEGLQEVRALAWRDAKAFPGAGYDDIVSAANYATMKAPEVCFEDPVKSRAFGQGGYVTTPPGAIPTPITIISETQWRLSEEELKTADDLIRRFFLSHMGEDPDLARAAHLLQVFEETELEFCKIWQTVEWDYGNLDEFAKVSIAGGNTTEQHWSETYPMLDYMVVALMRTVDLLGLEEAIENRTRYGPVAPLLQGYCAYKLK